MPEHRVVQQVEFENLDDFIKHQNSYYVHFLECGMGEIYRKTPHFKRFQQAYPDLEKEVSCETTRAVQAKPRQQLPYEKLWETYKLMSNLIFAEDEDVMDYCPKNQYLIA